MSVCVQTLPCNPVKVFGMDYCILGIPEETYISCVDTPTHVT